MRGHLQMRRASPRLSAQNRPTALPENPNVDEQNNPGEDLIKTFPVILFVNCVSAAAQFELDGWVLVGIRNQLIGGEPQAVVDSLASQGRSFLRSRVSGSNKSTTILMRVIEANNNMQFA
jgi:hypothetical protein